MSQSPSRPPSGPLTKVLIANRGEIAVRVARACTDAGVASVAVYSDPDADALHVRRADEAYALDGTSAADTYLDIGKLLDIARRAGADAVHPGYGFLSENADFAQAVIDAGLVWIGPSPEAIRALGDKVSARKIAVAAGAPLVPGTDGPAADAAQVRAFAEEHGLPVAIKAAFGGGGRGLKIVHRMQDVESAFESAVREAVAAFGRGECFVERFLEKPRHVEAQVLADTHGTVVVVGTRDCSLQRRNQKLVEEAPAPFLTDEQRERIHASARAICREAGYTGAGTVEYLVAPDGLVSFLEVNTRLQVEHPVTEATTGVDLVREQFRIAAGEPLSLTEDPGPRGHAIEFRLNAEDPALGFLPSPGTVEAFEAPTGAGVRVDTGVRSGSVVPGEYDSLLAKLIVWGEDRQQAIRRSRVALDELSIRGLPTVVPFHRAVLDHPDFTDPERLGVYTTWIESAFAAELETSPYLAAAAPGAARAELTVTVDGKAVSLGLPADLYRALRSGGVGAGGGAGAARDAGPGTPDDAGPGAAGAGAGVVTAPMNGTVVKWLAEDGAEVAAGQDLVVLEAMKMETAVPSPSAGAFSRSAFASGDRVVRGQELGRLG
jgi:acetyl-CoA/propionyl-CoA carboxylase, biotin carboxylase, biotin carboxyl carrier protein